MVHPYIINLLNALVLISTGVTGYFLLPSKPLVVLLAPAFGALLLACTYHLRKHNRFVFHTVTALTLLAGFILITRINLVTFEWDSENILILTMGLSCFVAALFYVATFVRERRQSNDTIYKEDL